MHKENLRVRSASPYYGHTGGGGWLSYSWLAEDQTPTTVIDSKIVDESSGGTHTIRHGFKVDGGGTDSSFGSLVPMCEVSTGGKVESHDTIVRFEETSIHSEVSW